MNETSTDFYGLSRSSVQWPVKFWPWLSHEAAEGAGNVLSGLSRRSDKGRRRKRRRARKNRAANCNFHFKARRQDFGISAANWTENFKFFAEHSLNTGDGGKPCAEMPPKRFRFLRAVKVCRRQIMQSTCTLSQPASPATLGMRSLRLCSSSPSFLGRIPLKCGTQLAAR